MAKSAVAIGADHFGNNDVEAFVPELVVALGFLVIRVGRKSLERLQIFPIVGGVDARAVGGLPGLAAQVAGVGRGCGFDLRVQCQEAIVVGAGLKNKGCGVHSGLQSTMNKVAPTGAVERCGSALSATW